MSNSPSLQDLIKEKSASSITPEKSFKTTQVDAPIDLKLTGSKFWSQVSTSAVNDYQKGVNIGKFGDNKFDINIALVRLATAIETIIKNMANENGVSTEKIALHFSILRNIMDLIATEIKSSEMEDETAKRLFIQLHGFLDQYLMIIKTQ